MTIETRIVGDVTILDIQGKMTLGHGDEVLRDTIRSLVSQGKKQIILKMDDVPYIDSAGLGEVVRSFIALSRQGGQLKLLSPTKRVSDLLDIISVSSVFEIFEKEEEAVKSFQP